MAHDQWLMQEDGEISLSARSIYELDVYIREVYKEDAIICPACNALVIRGSFFARSSFEIFGDAHLKRFKKK